MECRLRWRTPYSLRRENDQESDDRVTGLEVDRLLEDDHSFGESVPVEGSPVSMGV